MVYHTAYNTLSPVNHIVYRVKKGHRLCIRRIFIHIHFLMSVAHCIHNTQVIKHGNFRQHHENNLLFLTFFFFFLQAVNPPFLITREDARFKLL